MIAHMESTGKHSGTESPAADPRGEQAGAHVEGRQRGANLVEYMLLVTLIMVAAAVATKALGKKASQRFSTLNSVVW